MPPDFAFSTAGGLALTGWAALAAGAFLARARAGALLYAGLVLPLVLGVGYGVMIWSGRAAFETGGYGSIEAVRALFADDSALAAGWIHYLAFDLFVGAFILRDGAARGLGGLLLVPSFVATFLFGPLGFVLHVAVRTLAAGRAVMEARP